MSGRWASPSEACFLPPPGAPDAPSPLLIKVARRAGLLVPDLPASLCEVCDACIVTVKAGVPGCIVCIILGWTLLSALGSCSPHTCTYCHLKLCDMWPCSYSDDAKSHVVCFTVLHTEFTQECAMETSCQAVPICLSQAYEGQHWLLHRSCMSVLLSQD